MEAFHPSNLLTGHPATILSGMDAGRRQRAALARILISLFLGVPGSEALSAEKIVLQLKGSPSCQFAGYYMALEKGYYDKAGLDVEIRPGGSGVDPVSEVASGRAEYGVGTSSLLLAREKGQPVRVIAAIFQHSPLVIIARQRGKTDSVQDLLGARIMLEPRSEELVAYLRHSGLGPGSYTQLPYSYRLEDLIEGKTDAISAHSTIEAIKLSMMKFPFDMYTPRSEGIDFYGDNLFTSDREARTHGGRVEAFREASLRGWACALANPREAVDVIVSRYGSTEARDFLDREAGQIAALVRDDIVELGYMSRGRWEQIAGIYASLGMLGSAAVPAGFIWSPAPTSAWSWRLLGFVAIWVVVASTIAIVYWRLSRRLRTTLARVRMFETVIEQSPVSVIITDPETVIEFVNPGFTAVTGYTSKEVVGQRTKILKSGQTSRETIADLWAHLGRGETWVGEFVNRRKDGELFAEEAHIAPVTDDRGKVTHYVAVKLDITERKAAEAKIAHLAHNDVLTDLPNRALFADRFRQALIAAKRERSSLAVFCMDLDGFKPINDNYGHAAGDDVLREVSRRWSAAVRKGDTVARMGGDEFAVLAPGVRTPEEAVLIAKKLSSVLDEPIATQAAMVRVGSSVGWAIHPDDGSEAEALLRRADEALYADKAKRKGGREYW